MRLLCRVSLGLESRIYEIGNTRFIDWNETPLVLFKNYFIFILLKLDRAAMFFFNSETRDAVCLTHFPTRNYDFWLHGDVISHWESRKYDFPSPKKRGNILNTTANVLLLLCYKGRKLALRWIYKYRLFM